MTDINHDHSTPWLGLLVGGLIVVVAIIAYLIYTGAASTRNMNLRMSLPTTSDTPRPSPTPAPLPKPTG